ncbi:MAG: hypothetical protein R3B70_19635 [Polyangiaceae bacterium]
MPRRVPPPDFRYVSLAPASVPLAPATLAGTLGVAGFGAAFWSAGGDPVLLSVVGSMAAASALALARGTVRSLAGRSVREVPMAVVPWGVVLWPEAGVRVLRWPAVSKVEIDARHSLRGGTPEIEWTRVLVHTERETFAARARGAAGLERLAANLGAYAEEASRAPSADLDGEVPIEHDGTEPIAAMLLRHAGEVSRSGRGAARLRLPDGGYRRVGARGAGPETVAELRRALAASEGTPADPRPLSCALAADLQASELLPELTALVSSPHPLTAAFAMASALRLGASQSRAGSLDELAPFLFEDDVRALSAFAAGL